MPTGPALRRLRQMVFHKVKVSLDSSKLKATLSYTVKPRIKVIKKTK